MVMLQELSEGRKSSINSIASGKSSQSILVARSESTQQGSDVPLKVRKPYTISKQREKWTEEEHQRFIEAIKLYGRAWPQIEEYVGNKTAVQIRSHAQKFFSKVMKEGSGRKERAMEPIEIPPPRPKRKPLHPYPRKHVPTPNNPTLCFSFHETRKSTDLKTIQSESHSPTSVLASEGTQSLTSLAKDIASVSAFSTSSGSYLSHAVETRVMKDNLTARKEKETDRDFSLTLNLCTAKVDDLTNAKPAEEYKECLKSKIKSAPLKTIKLFGRTVVTSSPLEYSNSTTANALIHTGTTNRATRNDPVRSQNTKSISQLALSLNGRVASDNIMIQERKGTQEKENSIGKATTGLNCSLIIKKADKPETKKAYVHYTTEFKHGLKIYKREFLPYKMCSSDKEVAAPVKNHKDDMRNQHIYL